MVAKLYAGGGELTDHSRVHASQGSFSAKAPFQYERMRLKTNTRIAKPWMKAPIVTIRFSVSSTLRFVRINAAGHPQDSRDVHHIERHVKADHEEPEVQFAQFFAEHSPGNLGIPVIECGEHRKQNSTHNHIVKVRHDEVRQA